jgi:malto-oligosyltrehalose trehalohydrolase/4-alpha-glucanotransferase
VSQSFSQAASVARSETWPQGADALAQAALPDFLMRRRWYPAKDAGRPEVTPAAMIPFPGAGVPASIAIWRVMPPGQAPFLMLVPLAVIAVEAADPANVIAPFPNSGSRALCLVEAFSVDSFVRAWVAMLAGTRGAVGQLRAGQTEQLLAAGLEPTGDWPIRRFSAEQSNTSIRIGQHAILKAIRKLEEGIHPELEVGRFLTSEAGFTGIPAMLGWVELASGTERITLSVLQTFVPNQGDGWGWVRDRLATQDGRVTALRWIRRAGERTADMHRAFGTDTADPGFRPEPVTPADIRTWADAAHAMAGRALDGLTAAADQLPPDARTLAQSVLARRDALTSELDALLRHRPRFAKTRHHGDYHLGQVLVAGDDAIIVDFEGEPMRPLADRRAKHAALRDVAGMLRSLAYAAATGGPDLSGWLDDATATFLQAYFEAARGSASLPANRAEAERVLRFFMLEKALYEVVYELANRPDWVTIPLRGILALLDASTTIRAHRMPFGAEVQDDGTVRFRLWAPPHTEVRLALDGADPVAMRADDDGWHERMTDRAHPGTRYQFVLPDGLRVPDPASRYQPEDVHGPSEVIDPAAYAWRDTGWKGRPWAEAVVYELHVGAFTPDGTFQAAIGKLDHLVALGVTAIELMPIADFPGQRNWGYDGVLPYAPDSSYGRPEDLKALVDAAHARGLMVLLDVVYNHFGPDGAYIHVIAPQTFTERHKTPWGAAINTDGDEARPVREYFIHNALYWIEEFHLDGLRLDAVHAILDDSPKHLLTELAERVRGFAGDRPVHLILENEENAASRLRRNANGTPRWYTAQWNDDVHHVLHVAASGESNGYYGDYKGDTGKLGRALAEGFAFQGEMMPYRGHPRGEPSAELPPAAFVAFIQNHDQIGNRAFGDRLTAFAPAEAVHAIAAVYLLLPQVPMLFMGEEWGASQPFPFFCDFNAELAEAVRNGRREEFARFPEFQDPAQRDRIPDPTAEETFASARLAWNDTAQPPHSLWLDWYRRVLAVRHAEIMPRLDGVRTGGRYEVVGEGAVVVRWVCGDAGETLILAANLTDAAVHGFPSVSGRVIWQQGEAGEDGAFGPWTVRWSIEKPSDDRSALDRLAEKMGIVPEFRDARGTVVRASAETQRSLLAAMGVDAADDAAAETALADLERREWLRPLPPVQVVPDNAEGAAVDVVFPANTTSITWRLVLEDGGEQIGRSDFQQLALLDQTNRAGRAVQRRRLLLPGGLPWGYHQLEVHGDTSACTTLIVTPGRCWLPPALADGRRLWGIAAQLYLLRSATDWGIGDFGDLRRLVELSATHGAAVIGLNPLHALFLDNPTHASPYSPASRLLLNILNIDVPAVAELLDCQAARDLVAADSFRQAMEACRTSHLVNYAKVADLKLRVLRTLYDACRAAQTPARSQAFQAFRQAFGPILDRTCLFLALREHFAAQDPALADWHAWPEAYRNPASAEVARFAAGHQDHLDFLAWLQWIADEQLGEAAAAAAERGMAVGLYRDLAVGADRAGAETWANPAAVVSGAQVGAPPDIHNPAGQDWGLPPFHPRALREEAYRSFVDLVRANMRHSGGLRIDHVMGLQQLYWVPQGAKPSAGAYVRYPMADLVGILALESQRHRCLVVGEDLGTVPEGFREHMADANVLSYRVLYFEQDAEGAFLPPSAYPKLAVAVVGSHDLPTLRGWWEGRDLELKQSLGLFPGDNEYAHQREARDRDRAQLLAALRREELLPATGDPDIPTLSRAAHRFLAHSPAVLALAQIDDLTDEGDPVNVPATTDEHPNWRRRLSMTLEDIATRPRFVDIAEIFRNERGAHHV